MMKKIMLHPSPLSSGVMGSALRCIGVGRILRSRGYEVCFVNGGKQKKFIEREGFKCYDLPSPVTNGTQQDIRSLVDFFEWSGMTDEKFAQASIISELKAIHDFKPDAIFSETRLSSVISAKICDIPIMSVAAWPRSPDFPANIPDYGVHTNVYNRILDQYGLENVNHLAELLFTRSDMKISPSIPALEPELLQYPDVMFMGYVLDIDFEKEIIARKNNNRKKDIILVYLSVGAINPELYYKTIIETFGDTKEQVIVACGYHYAIKNDLKSPCDNIKFVQYINISSIINRVKLILFHGGQDTMMTSLLFGIPSITIPGKHFEREYNSAALVKLGVSEQLPVYGFRPNRLKKAVNDSYSKERIERCRYWKQRMRQYKGTQSCVDNLLYLIRKKI